MLNIRTFLEFFKKKNINQISTFGTNEIIISKLVPELKNFLMKKNVFYDLDIKNFRIKKNNTKFTFTIEIYLSEIIRTPFFLSEVNLCSFFNDYDWNLIVSNVLTTQELDIYNVNKNIYINRIVYFLFANPQYLFAVPNLNTDLIVEFNDRLIFLENGDSVNISDLNFKSLKKYDLISSFYCKFNYNAVILPVHFIYFLLVVSPRLDVYMFLRSFFFNFFFFYIGFLYNHKNLSNIVKINIVGVKKNIIFICKEMLNKKINNLELTMSTTEVDLLIRQLKIFLDFFFLNIVEFLYINQETNSFNKSKYEFFFNKIPHVTNEEDSKTVDNFIEFIKKIIIYSDPVNISKFKADTMYLFCSDFIDFVHKKEEKLIFKFIEHLEINYLTKLLELKKTLEEKDKKFTHILQEFNDLFGRDEYIYLVVYSVQLYIQLVSMSDNFSKKLDLEYYEYFLKLFKH